MAALGVIFAASAHWQATVPPVPPPPAPDYAAVARLVAADQAAQAGDTDAAADLIRVLMPDGDRAVAIARRESGLRCDADNPRSSAAGLFQLMKIHEPRAERLGVTWGEVESSCLANIVVAHDLWAEQGWRPWRLS